MKGLRVSVYRRPAADGSNHDATALGDRATLIGPGIPESSPPSELAPALQLEQRPDGWVAVPLERPIGCEPPSFGGSFVCCSDARFLALSDTPIPVHDRFDHEATPCP